MFFSFEAVAIFLFLTLRTESLSKKAKGMAQVSSQGSLFVSFNYFFQANDNLTRQTDTFSVNFHFIFLHNFFEFYT